MLVKFFSTYGIFTKRQILTWPVYVVEQTGQRNMVEHINCTNDGVKLCRALLEGGGRHNLFP